MRGSWRAPAGIVLFLGAAIVLAALITKGAGGTAGPTASAGAGAALQDETASPGAPRGVPSSVACHELDRSSCLAIVGAALAVLPEDAPVATSAAAWASLLCDSTIDCPPVRLRLATARGSVVVSFDDGGPDAWLNVIEVPVAGVATGGTEAWIVRWDRPPSASPMPSAPRTPQPATSR
jgi:hypothetical protein